jgi:hypothetical protein
MLWSVGVERINENIRIDNSWLNGHRCRCRAGAMSLRTQDSRPAIPVQPLDVDFILKQAQDGILHQMFGIRPRLWWQSAQAALPARA